MLTATASRISGARARAISSVKMICCFSVAPRPPCSRGHWMPTQPPPASVALPGALELAPLVLVVRRCRGRKMRREPGPQLGAKRLVLHRGCPVTLALRRVRG